MRKLPKKDTSSFQPGQSDIWNARGQRASQDNRKFSLKNWNGELPQAPANWTERCFWLDCKESGKL